jgi:hypothetical protein
MSICVFTILLKKEKRKCCSCKDEILFTFVSRRNQQCSDGRLDEASTCRSIVTRKQLLRLLPAAARCGWRPAAAGDDG